MLTSRFLHLAALCVSAAMMILPLSVDNLLIDIASSYHEFSEIQTNFSDIKPLKVLKHSTTHVGLRITDQWPALYCYFDNLTITEWSTDDCALRHFTP